MLEDYAVSAIAMIVATLGWFGTILLLSWLDHTGRKPKDSS